MAEIRIRDGDREVRVAGGFEVEDVLSAALQAWNESGLSAAWDARREPIGFVLQQTPPITELAEER